MTKRSAEDGRGDERKARQGSALGVGSGPRRTRSEPVALDAGQPGKEKHARRALTGGPFRATWRADAATRCTLRVARRGGE